ncbi:hypothetical protein ZPR_0478 [Zunongwangia profunda SM-A87]|uniref:Uncharacterized protein n=1 Tax=Zunongwangia profunda (strain DSM 18752 / CCTCC AB 206139 / SM-A87) TaxID=655815 RepID=D5BEV8_ZUNPS|nr:hypothetical protein ZPR_0478 [Zunongwangia profunda SM-A87]
MIHQGPFAAIAGFRIKQIYEIVKHLLSGCWGKP